VSVETIQRHHHVTLCVGGAQEDYDFHTQVLGLKSVKKTALYDGTYPIYHLYYGNDLGEESTLVTCFPMRQSGRRGRRGAGQITALSLSVPESALPYWGKRLAERGLAPRAAERFGTRVLLFQHPCGIDYELAGVADDDRKPWTGGGVPAELGVRGTHGITVSARESAAMDEFLCHAWSARPLGSERRANGGRRTRYVLEKGGPGRIVDVEQDPDAPEGTWTFGEGTVHHCAFQVADFAAQDAVKARLEALGFTDVSERKDRGYFFSIYVRSPSGALFEATVSKPEGFLIDEPYASLGRSFQVPPVFAERKREILEFLEPLAAEPSLREPAVEGSTT
jgi:glyoxalase family protein